VLADTPNFDALYGVHSQRGQVSFLDACEGEVGLPKGQIGNSEVGHMNIGAGRIVWQDIGTINNAIENGSIATQPALVEHIAKLKASGGTSHLMGCLSPGGVHAMQEHIAAIANIINASGVKVSENLRGRHPLSPPTPLPPLPTHTVTLELRVDTAGGHSSMPPIKEEGAVSIIAKAVTKLEANPFPAKFSRGSNMRKQLQFLSPMFSTPMRVVTSNLWLFSPLLKKVLLRASNGAAAMLRTTTAVTVIQGGDKYNVLPYTVKAYVNHRIHPEDTLEGVIEYDKKVIDDDRIKVTVVGGVTPASKVSSLTSNSFAWVKESVANVFNNPSTCSLMIGNTDTRHYWNLSNDIYRFSPVNLHVKELGMFHGLNERISVDNLAGVCLYYRELMLRAQQK